MQATFNYLTSPELSRRPVGLRCVGCIALLLITVLVSDTAIGQGRSPGQPHDFGDTPSPTEMMARLKYHKQHDTPLFDLLRETGVDIFSKLSDDEKKLAGRFVEDLILKEGMNSEKVSSLLEQMNIGSEARQALQEEIERTGADESAITPEQRKKLADKIRKDFMERSVSQSPSEKFDSPADRNSRLSGGQRKPIFSRDLDAANELREELGLEKITDEDIAPTNRGDEPNTQQARGRLQRATETTKRPND